MQSGRCLPLRSSLGTNRHASLLNEQRLPGFSFPRKPEPSSAFPALAANALATCQLFHQSRWPRPIALAPLRTAESKVPALETDPQPELWKHTQEARVTEGQEESFVSSINKFWLQGKTLSAAGSGFFSFDPTSRKQDRSRQPYDWTRLRDRWELSHLARGAGTPKLAACGGGERLNQQHKTLTSHWRSNPHRPDTSVKSPNRFKSVGVSCFCSKRQRQFPFARPGKFIRASEPRPSTSCRGTTAISATEVRIA
jgi:hypothetical protein